MGGALDTLLTVGSGLLNYFVSWASHLSKTKGISLSHRVDWEHQVNSDFICMELLPWTDG